MTTDAIRGGTICVTKGKNSIVVCEFVGNYRTITLNVLQLPLHLRLS
eukprot:SAG11_NODE_1611_length_4583_cov_3.380687_5_plen_47_part_00